MKQIFLLLTLTVVNTGCGISNCEKKAKDYRPRECAIKVASRFGSGRLFSIEGTNVYNSNLRNRYSDLGSWYSSFEKCIAVGDTVIKRKNELVFYIHKKDTVLSFPYECEGTIVK